ncbi:MAG TPA: hypothetical protein PK875_01430 [Spirochaetota bacterium]|nr:hypothetical protein [Spirochaetota bacterium]HPI15569.1 hypothetical protein [Spirochaetota bacterium]HPO44434.1 hypothetical protein [Spirochaetota bacterium]
MKNKILVFAVLVFALSIISCAGGRKTLRFDALTYPCSLSPFLYDVDGSVLAKGKDLKVVGEFKMVKDFWGIGYSVIPVSSDADVAIAMNKRIKELNGDGIINLKVTSSETNANLAVFFTFLPIWPGCTTVTINGEVVKKL